MPIFPMSTFNPDVHRNLLDLGYKYDRSEASWEDVGNGETGPMLTGGPAFEAYESADDTIYIDEHGKMIAVEPTEPEDPLGDWHGCNE